MKVALLFIWCGVFATFPPKTISKAGYKIINNTVTVGKENSETSEKMSQTSGKSHKKWQTSEKKTQASEKSQKKSQTSVKNVTN